MTTLAPEARIRHERRVRAVYGTLRRRHRAARRIDASPLAELGLLVAMLAAIAGVVALRAWLHVPGL